MLFSYIIVFVCAVGILSTDVAARRHFGRSKSRSTCREPTIFQNINVTGILGHWYEYSRHDHDFEQGCDCYTTDVAMVDESSFQISNCCQMTKVSNETQTCNIGVDNARVANADKNEALFLYTRSGGPTVESEIWIVDTDYDNYMIVDACEHVSDDQERELFWIMTREKVINEDVVKKINDVLRTSNFERSKIIRQRHGADVCRSQRPPRRHGNRGYRNRGRGNHDRGHGNHDRGHGNQDLGHSDQDRSQSNQITNSISSE